MTRADPNESWGRLVAMRWWRSISSDSQITLVEEWRELGKVNISHAGEGNPGNHCNFFWSFFFITLKLLFKSPLKKRFIKVTLNLIISWSLGVRDGRWLSWELDFQSRFRLELWVNPRLEWQKDLLLRQVVHMAGVDILSSLPYRSHQRTTWEISFYSSFTCKGPRWKL